MQANNSNNPPKHYPKNWQKGTIHSLKTGTKISYAHLQKAPTQLQIGSINLDKN